MSEEIKDLFQRENIKTMKKDLRGLAELETQERKEQFLDAPQKEKISVPVPPPPPAVDLKKLPSEPGEGDSSESDAVQQLANRFARIKKDQEEKARILEERHQKDLEEQKKAESQTVNEKDQPGEKTPEQKRREEDHLAEQKKIEEEKKDQERLDNALAIAQENIINTAKVPPAPATDMSKKAQTPSAPVPPAPLPPTPAFSAPKDPESAPLKNNSSGDLYKEAVEETKKTGNPNLFAKKGAPFFSASASQQGPKDQVPRSEAVKKESAPVFSKEPLKKGPIAEPRQEAPVKPVIPIIKTVEEKKKDVPEEKPAAKPFFKPIEVKPVAPVVADEKELLKSLDEKEKAIDKDLLKIVQEKIPVNLQSEKISKEIEKIKQSELQGILAEEAETELSIKQLESKERSAGSSDEKRRTEAERQEIEMRREKIEEKRYQVEDNMKSLEAQLGECKNNYLRISEKEKKLLKEKADIKNQKEIISLSKKKTALEQSLSELNEKTDSLKTDLASILKEKEGLGEKLAQASKEEQDTETEIELLESQEADAKESVHLREIEAQRKILAAKRKEAEKTRWDIEDQKKEIEIKEAEIKKEHQKTVRKMEEISKELKMIEDRSAPNNG